jgi:OFA family oxalate/formate antiporter-like MFS transporter
MFFLVAAGGLMSAAQLAPIAKERGIADATITIFGLTTPAIVAALTLHSITNGVGRPLNGWISDHIGRGNMMGLAFGIEAIAIAAFGFFGTTPGAFVLTDAAVFLFWGDIFSLFAATVGDAFGRKYVTVNYGIMYTAKGAAALLVPVGNVLTHFTGNWHAVYAVGCAFNAIAALLGFFVLKPLIKSRLSVARPPVVPADDFKRAAYVGARAPAPASENSGGRDCSRSRSRARVPALAAIFQINRDRRAAGARRRRSRESRCRYRRSRPRFRRRAAS